MKFTALTYNIQLGIFSVSNTTKALVDFWKYFVPNDKKFGLDSVVNVLKKYKPDFVGLQEIDVGSFRSSFVNQSNYLAKESGYKYKKHGLSFWIPMIFQHGNSIFSKYKILNTKIHSLPYTVEPRIVFESNFNLGKKKLTVLVTHLSVLNLDRHRQIKKVMDIVNSFDNEVVLLGDFNAVKNSTIIKKLEKKTGLRSSFHEKHKKSKKSTFPVWYPIWYFDYIFVSEGIKVLDSKIIDTIASDHYPVISTLEI